MAIVERALLRFEQCGGGALWKIGRKKLFGETCITNSVSCGRNIRWFWRKGETVENENQEQKKEKREEKTNETLEEKRRKIQARGLPQRRTIPGVSHVVVVASGKGGVGKSTTAVNLALALSTCNNGSLQVGICDADVFGPSVPTMMNLNDSPEIDEKEMMIPLTNFGLKVMSIGFLVGPDAPVVLRGLMVMQWIERLMFKVRWGPLDVLVVDTPPGTGDTQLSLSQNVHISGAVIVSTPQDLSLIDARRGVQMFEKVQVPVLGLVQNMSTFICPNCNHRSHIFGQDGAKKMAEELDIDLVGDIPLNIEIRETADGGRPIVVSKPDSPQAQAYRDIALKIICKLKL